MTRIRRQPHTGQLRKINTDSMAIYPPYWGIFYSGRQATGPEGKMAVTIKTANLNNNCDNLTLTESGKTGGETALI